MNADDFLPVKPGRVLISHTDEHNGPCQQVLEKILDSLAPLYLLLVYQLHNPLYWVLQMDILALFRKI
jgi:hypothetical protein